MAATEPDGAREAAGQVERLTRDLQARGYAARLVIVGKYMAINVAHRTVTQMSETVIVAPATDGTWWFWWFWWSWRDPIVRASDVDVAAFKIAYVLTPTGA